MASCDGSLVELRKAMAAASEGTDADAESSGVKAERRSEPKRMKSERSVKAKTVGGGGSSSSSSSSSNTSAKPTGERKRRLSAAPEGMEACAVCGETEDIVRGHGGRMVNCRCPKEARVRVCSECGCCDVCAPKAE